MKKKILFYLLLIFFGAHAKAQQRNNQLAIIAEGTVPAFQYDEGIGGYLKGFYGTGNSTQLTFMLGISRFASKNSVEKPKTTTRLIPFMAGLRKNLQQFYIEPQIGFGELSGKIYSNGDFASPSVGALFWAIGVGYQFNRVFAGLRFESVHGIEGSSAGLWYNQNFHYTGIHIGYNLFAKK